MRPTTLTFLIVVSSATHADSSCLQSFDIKPGKTVSDFTWLPGSLTQGIGPTDCRALELARQAYFVDKASLIDVAKLAQINDYKAEIERTIAAVEKAEAELQSKLSQDAALNGVRLTYRVLKYEFGKASALIGCFAPDPTASKLFCALGLSILVEDTASVLDGTIAKTDISVRAKELRTRVTELKSQYEILREKEGNFDMSLAQKEHSEIFLGMCEAVRSSCL